MITMREIGHYGRLGNQLFQYAMIRSVAEKNGCDYWFPVENEEPIDGRYNPVIGKNDTSSLQVFDCFGVPYKCISSFEILEHTRNNYNEPPHEASTFNPAVFECGDGTNYHGYFQSWKYHDQNVIDGMEFRRHIRSACIKYLEDIKEKHDTEYVVGLHMRRGDGLMDSGAFQVALDLGYYYRCLDTFGAKRFLLLVFSDDIDFCKMAFGDSHNTGPVEYSKFSDNKSGEAHFYDLCLMSMCDGFIMANSSFSWWGARLNKNGKILCPSRWWGYANRHFDERDLRYPEWTVMQI